jgi:hypothetical protein
MTKVFKPSEFLDSGAVIIGNYRYTLWRIWDRSKPILLYIMLNPSTADDVENDPTIRRCIGFAHELGYGGIMVVNLFAYRSVSPDALGYAKDPIGPNNDHHILVQARAADRIICAWGPNGAFRDRDIAVMKMLREGGVTARIECLRLTKANHPGHPLYIMSGTVPITFKGRIK